jgi:hypothetical protein
MTVVNSWLLYKRVCEENDNPIEYTLAKWRRELAYCLCNSGVQKLTKGRRSNSFDFKMANTRPQS